MEKLGLNQIRTAFQDFYISKDHFKRGSASLIPKDDKSLLLINSGMAPLKPFFSGQKEPPAKRMTTCQKCIRTGDIDNVGYTSRHGTFFEMLGSFSFGDYFKKESLTWGWEFITKVLEMPEDKLWATVYEEDQEAYDIWKNDIGLPEKRIVRLGKDDNFWEIGTGPCGPCSEIYYDRGEKYGCGSPDCRPGCECDRYIEFWNHVFTQFSKDEDGNYTDLAHPNIDTGMGLERLACIMQDTDSIFDIDTIKYILDAVVAKCGIKYCNGDADTDVSIRIITDHIRSVTFMISDGIMPSNEGRRYVLRRLLRRASRHGKLLGIEEPFLAELSGKVVDQCAGAYPQLEERRVFIRKIIQNEETTFNKTLTQGADILSDYMENLKAKGQTILDGERVFKLYDTYGFPLELTDEILGEQGFTADTAGFDACMEQQRKMGKIDNEKQADEGWEENGADIFHDYKTEFTGYSHVVEESEIIALATDKKPAETLRDGDKGQIILNKTPFYAKSGGQTGDIGMIYNDSFVALVTDTTKSHKAVVHNVILKKGQASVGENVFALIKVPYRNQCARNHTATHLLHKALREVLGEHVRQEGSNVTSEGLRFDFNHYEPMTAEQQAEVESIVNEKINDFLPVKIEEMTIEDAAKSDAIGLFESKYGDVVRVVSVGQYSKELCGGTHVENSGQIGAFKIKNESSAASGIRRIEAITGEGLLQQLNDYEKIVEKSADALKVKNEQIISKINGIIEENKNLKRELETLKEKAISSGIDDLGGEMIGDVKLIAKVFDDTNISQLRTISDKVKETNHKTAMVFAGKAGGKITLLVSLTDDLTENGLHAGKMIKEIAAAAGGGGGGKANMAQAGVKDPEKLDAAFDVARQLLQ